MTHYEKLLHPLYWIANPSVYASKTIGPDFMSMPPVEFIAKYVHIMEDEEELSIKRIDIELIVLPLYREMFGMDYELKIKI